MSDSKFLIANFRSWAGEHQINLDSINLLLGGNSSGKSSIIHALSLLKQSNLTNRLIPTGEQIDLGRMTDQLNNQAKSKDPTKREGQMGFGIITSITKQDGLIEFQRPGRHRGRLIERRASNEKRQEDAEIFHANFSTIEYIEYYDSLGQLKQVFLNWKNIPIIKISVTKKPKTSNIKVEVTAEKKFWDKLLDKQKLVYSENSPEILFLRERLELYQKRLSESSLKKTNSRERDMHADRLEWEISRIASELDRISSDDEELYKNGKINYDALSSCLSFDITVRNEKLDSINISRICSRLCRGGPSADYLMDTLGITRKNNLHFYKVPNFIDSVRRVGSSMGLNPFDLLTLTRGKFNSMVQSVDRIGPHRERPDRISIINPNERGSFVGIYGEKLNTAMNGISDKQIKTLNTWFEILEIPYKIDRKFHQQFNIFQVFLIDEEQNKISLSDVGYGIGQVLPIILTCLLSKRSIITIEQPELHLHPKLQANLADLFIKSAHENQNVFLLETHSEHIVLRFKRRQRENALAATENITKPLTEFKKVRKRPKYSNIVNNPYGEGNFEVPLWKNVRESLTITVVNTKKSPQTSQTTAIKLNRKGEFDTIWPGDFFPERYVELGLED